MKHFIISHLTKGAKDNTPADEDCLANVLGAITKVSNWNAALSVAVLIFGEHTQQELEEHFLPYYGSISDIEGGKLKEWSHINKGRLHLLVSPQLDEIYYMQSVV